MRLAMKDFYKEKSENSSKTADREKFLDSILGSGLLVFISPVWLAEVFDSIMEIDVFEFSVRGQEAKYNGLKNLLNDLDGFGLTHKGAQLMCDFKRFKVAMSNIGEEGRFR